MLRINGEPVDPSLIEDTFARLKAEAEALSQVSCCERDDEFRARAEQEVIDGILLSQEAERRTPEPPADEIRAAFEQTLREWREHGASWELLDSQRSHLRSETVARMKLERFTRELWSTLPELTEDDLREWYRTHPADFRTPAAAQVLHLVHFPAAEDPWEDYSRMLDLRRRALEGEDFAGLALAHTGKKDREIDLGWIEQERIFNPFEAMLFSLREQEISPVFYYEQAYHLVKAIAIRPADVRPFEEVIDTLREERERHRRREALQALATDLRTTAEIVREEGELEMTK